VAVLRDARLPVLRVRGERQQLPRDMHRRKFVDLLLHQSGHELLVLLHLPRLLWQLQLVHQPLLYEQHRAELVRRRRGL